MHHAFRRFRAGRFLRTGVFGLRRVLAALVPGLVAAEQERKRGPAQVLAHRARLEWPGATPMGARTPLRAVVTE